MIRTPTALAALALCIALASCAVLGASGTPKQLVERKRVIVTLRPDTPERWASSARGLQTDYALRQVGAFPLRSLGVQCLVFEIPDERPLPDVLLRLQADERVEAAQINQLFSSESSPSASPSYARLQYATRAIGADAAHVRSTGKGIRIAVIDTGIDRDHPDLQGRVLMNMSFLDDGDATFTGDRHGTAMAGIIAALDDGAGISGIAPDAAILAL
jgi:subtilisin family serine protease